MAKLWKKRWECSRGTPVSRGIGDSGWGGSGRSLDEQAAAAARRGQSNPRRTRRGCGRRTNGSNPNTVGPPPNYSILTAKTGNKGQPQRITRRDEHSFVLSNRVSVLMLARGSVPRSPPDLCDLEPLPGHMPRQEISPHRSCILFVPASPLAYIYGLPRLARPERPDGCLPQRLGRPPACALHGAAAAASPVRPPLCHRIRVVVTAPSPLNPHRACPRLSSPRLPAARGLPPRPTSAGHGSPAPRCRSLRPSACRLAPASPRHPASLPLPLRPTGRRCLVAIDGEGSCGRLSVASNLSPPPPPTRSVLRSRRLSAVPALLAAIASRAADQG